MNVQYDLFEANDDISLLKQEIEMIDERTRNVQRGLFSRHNNLSKEIEKRMDQQDEKINMLEKHIKNLTEMLVKEVK